MEIFNLINYSSNPSGKGSAIIANQKDLKEKYQNTLTNLENDIKIKWYKLKNSTLICHILLPSTSIENIKYDILFSFKVDNLDSLNAKTLNYIPMQVFSNCPSFTYTYAYTFNKNNLLIPWLKNKIPTKVLSKNSQVRNKYNIISYEKSLYLSTLFLLDGRTNLSIIKQIAIPINDVKQLTTSINRSDYIVDLYNFEKEKIKTQETKKEKSNSTNLNQKNKNNNNYKKPNTSSISKVKKTPKISKVPKTKKVKKI